LAIISFKRPTATRPEIDMGQILLNARSETNEMSEPSGLREKKRLKTRRAILSAAWVLFTRDGANATSIRAIAELAEVSDVTVYTYFETREALIDAVVDEQSNFQALTDALASRPSSEGPLEAYRALAMSEREYSKTDIKRTINLLRVIKADPILYSAYLNRQMFKARELVKALAPRAKLVGMADMDLHLLCRLLVAASEVAVEVLPANTSSSGWVLAENHLISLLSKGWK
jgi:AcrR family transcriptional regulator